MSNFALRILVANDQPSIRSATINIMREAYPAAFFGEAGSGREALLMVLGDDWDVVILDSMLPGASGIPMVKRIKAVKPALPVILTTLYTSPQTARWAARAGASAYIAYQAAPEELLAVLRAILPKATGATLVAAS